jgi:hypothetical protein
MRTSLITLSAIACAAAVSANVKLDNSKGKPMYIMSGLFSTVLINGPEFCQIDIGMPIY